MKNLLFLAAFLCAALQITSAQSVASANAKYDMKTIEDESGMPNVALPSDNASTTRAHRDWELVRSKKFLPGNLRPILGENSDFRSSDEPEAAQDLLAEMMALANAWKAALERGDAAAICTLYTEKVDFINPKDGSITTRTRAEIEAGMKQTLESKTGTLEFVPGSSATLLPDGRVSVKGEFIQTMTDKKTGEKQVFNGLFDHQVVKEGGQWKFCVVKVTPKG